MIKTLPRGFDVGVTAFSSMGGGGESKAQLRR